MAPLHFSEVCRIIPFQWAKLSRLIGRIEPNKFCAESSRTNFLYTLAIFWAAMEKNVILISDHYFI
jgi:hypothetical protein